MRRWRPVTVLQGVAVASEWAWFLTAEEVGILLIGGFWTALFLVVTHPFRRILP